MADRKQINKYYPPDWEPKKGTLNQYQKQHPLRHRARKLKEGILVIRFEAPFNMWCLGCNKMIAKGVRFNAEKKCVGQYFSTKIWQFSMRCAGCSHKIIIRTDPEHTAYICESGVVQKEETYNEESAETIKLLDEEEKDKLHNDPMFNLEFQTTNKERFTKEMKNLQNIQDINDIYHHDDYNINSKLRSKLRKEKKISKDLSIKQKKIDVSPISLSWDNLSLPCTFC